MRILITNTVALNVGDAAILCAEIELLRATFGQSVQFIIYDSQPEIASQYYPDLTFRKSLYWSIWNPVGIKYLRWFIAHIKLLRFRLAAWSWSQGLQWIAKFLLPKEELQDLVTYGSADLIISTGGTLLVENYRLKPRIFDYEISLILKRPLIFFTQSLGPFSNPANRQSLKPIFEKSILVLLRDQKSKDHLIELGVRTPNIYVTSDIVFALADAASVQQAMNQKVLPYSSLRVAISVREWKHFKTQDAATGMQKYVEALQAVTIHLVEKYNAKITYISTCQGIPEYWTDDSKTAWRIIESLPESIKAAISLNQNFHPPSELVNMMKNYDLVISTRLHMAILALGVGTPVLPIAYEFKTQELFERFGLKFWVQDIEEVCNQSLTKTLDSFVDTLPHLRQRIFESVEQERKCALKSSLQVKEALENWQGSQTK